VLIYLKFLDITIHSSKILGPICSVDSIDFLILFNGISLKKLNRLRFIRIYFFQVSGRSWSRFIKL